MQRTSGSTFGLYYFIRDSIVSFAAFPGGLLWRQSPVLNLMVAACFGIAGTLFFLFLGKDNLSGSIDRKNHSSIVNRSDKRYEE